MNNHSIKVLNIIERTNLNSTKIMDNTDFSTVIDHIIDAAEFKQNALPAVIDWKNSKIFLSDSCSKNKVNTVPFFYQWQRSNIEQLFSIDFSQYKRIPLKTQTVLPIFVFSIGRCGSTLLVNLCKNIGIKTISEPDYLADIKNRLSVNQSEDEVIEILKWNTNLLSEIFGTNPLIKLRGSSINDIDYFAKAFPQSKYVFMLREPIAWAKSNMKAFNDTPEALADYLKRGIEVYDQFIKLGLKPKLIWYEDLIMNPIESLNSIFNDLSLIESGRDAILTTMSKDSQEGSSISKDRLVKIKLQPEALDRFIQQWKKICPNLLIEKYKLDRLIIN